MHVRKFKSSRNQRIQEWKNLGSAALISLGIVTIGLVVNYIRTNNYNCSLLEKGTLTHDRYVHFENGQKKILDHGLLFTNIGDTVYGKLDENAQVGDLYSRVMCRP